MARVAGIVLVLLASASIALGSPLCCLIGNGCCGAGTTVDASRAKRDCCSHGKRDEPGKPAPKPSQEKNGCQCKHAATHATVAEHAPFVAIHDVPAMPLPERALEGVATTAHPAPQPSPAPRSHPLLL